MIVINDLVATFFSRTIVLGMSGVTAYAFLISRGFSAIGDYPITGSKFFTLLSNNMNLI